VDYTYALDREVKQYITNAEIRNIQHQDYRFLKNYIVSKQYDDDISIVYDDYKIDVDVVYPNYAAYDNIVIYRKNTFIKELHGIWGFALKEIRGQKYITVLEQEKHDGYSVLFSTIEFHLTVYKLPAFEIVYENYFQNPVSSLQRLK
jgi:hypothetical protein